MIADLKRFGCLASGVCVCAFAFGTTGVSTSGTEITVCVEAGETLSMPAIGSEITKVFKTGAGEAQFTPAGVTNSFTAELHIQAGTLSGYRASFGKAAKIAVTPGATLKLTGYDAGFAKNAEDSSMRLGAAVLEIGGSGVDGNGAFVRTFSNYPRGTFGLFSKTTLTADTTINTGGGYFQFNNGSSPVFDMAGYELTCCGGGRFDFTSGKVKNLGNVRLMDTLINFESNPSYDENPNGAQVIFDGGSLMTWSSGALCPFGFRISKNASFGINGGSYTWDCNRFTGPVEVEAGNTWSIGDGGGEIPRRFTVFGSVTNRGVISKSSSLSFRISGSKPRELGTFYVESGSMLLEDAGYASASNVVVMGSNSPTSANVAKLVVTGQTALASAYGLTALKANYLSVGHIDSRYGIVELFEGGAITNNLRNSAGYGAFYQHGGIFRNTARQSYDSNPVQSGYGAYVLESGELTFGSFMHYANYKASGFFVQHGGYFATTENDGTPCNGVLYFGGTQTHTHFYQDGGTNKLGYVGFNHDAQVSTNVTSAFTVTGEKTLAQARTLRLNIGSDNAGPNRVCVNLNDGGTLAAGQITKGSEWGYDTSSSTVPYRTPNCRIYLNFNGGVFRMSESTYKLFGGDSATLLGTEPERVTVYEKGAVVDTQGFTVNWTKPFLAPTGRRIKSITITDSDQLAANYALGPCAVVISDETGEGASAITDFDSTNRQLSAEVIVTSGGFGFSENPTVAVQTSAKIGKTVAASVETEVAPTTGGLTKRGSGILKVYGINTYGGATRLEGGTLAFQDANGFTGSDLEIPAETLAEMTGSSAPLLTLAGTLEFNSGKGIVITGAEKLEEFSKTSFRSRRTVARFATARSSLPSLRLVDTDGTERTDPLWVLSLSAGGTEVKVGPQFGTVLLMR